MAIEPARWIAIKNRYPIGTRVRGTVMHLEDFGAFVRLDHDDVAALVLVTNIEDGTRSLDMHDYPQIGSVVEATVVDLIEETAQVRLSMRPSDLRRHASAHLQTIVARLADAGLAMAHDVRGCSAHDIAELEGALGVTLPVAYRVFLEKMGCSAGRFLTGTDVRLDTLRSLKPDAARLLRECAPSLVLTPTAFVFAVHQGYEFLFFECGPSGDPPVFLFTEGEQTFRRVAETFSAWLDGCVSDEIAAYDALGE
ncbi:MAG: SMI1/KNR4 family protein [Deltaproteobacteria bacterium]|nr:SMI1/KNR4 family protein [Deltaproteobacteria bacterium]